MPGVAIFQCSVCDEYFDEGHLGHCPRCAHHYVAGEVCGNCHRHVLRKTMRHTTLTETEWIAMQKRKETQCSKASP